MSEEEKNIQFINKKLLKQHIKLSEKELKAVYNICRKYYKEGLEQGRFDAMMDKLELIKWLESKNQFHYKNGKVEDNYILVSEVLNKVRGD